MRRSGTRSMNTSWRIPSVSFVIANQERERERSEREQCLMRCIFGDKLAEIGEGGQTGARQASERYRASQDYHIQSKYLQIEYL